MNWRDRARVPLPVSPIWATLFRDAPLWRAGVWGALLLMAAAASAPVLADGLALRETPSLADAVKQGDLPPVAERAPRDPAIVTLKDEDKAEGRPGGVLHILMSRARDTRLMVVYGYARLVAFNEKFEILPDILKSLDIEDGRSFTFHLRAGMRWSDGHPFTTEDFRYYWEDVANNKKLSPWGLPDGLLVDGEAPKFEVLDATTVRYSWSKPNPLFLALLADASPLDLYMPAHYLKQFHAKYADPVELAQLVKKFSQRNWAALHTLKGHMQRNDNPDLPTVQPWVNTTPAPAERFVFKRNPYYYRFDAAGHQLPYIDEVDMSIADPKLIPLKVESGETELQARYLSFDDYTFLKRGEKRNDYAVRLWRSGLGAELALYPNLNVKDQVWREIMRDVRFRRALSLAINRYEINRVVYFGLGIESNNTVLSNSPLFEPRFQTAWTSFDLDTANGLLDAMGLTKRDANDVRLLPDGRPMQIIVETAGESTEQTDVLQLIQDTWRELGVRLFVKPSQREVFRNRVFSGDAMMVIWAGLDDGVPTADVSPGELAPTSQEQLQWPKWGDFYDSHGKTGEAPDMPQAKELVQLNHAWEASADHEERARIWKQMLAINAEQQYTIGIVAAVPQPVVVSGHLRNVPKEAIWNWNPGAQFGVYKPDTFWFDTSPPDPAVAANQP